MLDVAFYETPDYRTLLESSDRPIVVGRRGTGKSALCYELQKYWSRNNAVTVLNIVPEEDQVIGSRLFLKSFGQRYNQVKAGSRIAWKYALIMEAALSLLDHWKFHSSLSYPILEKHLQAWRKLGPTVCSRFRSLLAREVATNEPAESLIGGLTVKLNLTEAQDALLAALGVTKRQVVVLVDQLDEGYEPDEIGSGLVGGFAHAVVDLNHQLPNFRAYVFLRDNLFKAIGKLDPDYSKNIEGRYLRLHWDEQQLFDLVCARLKTAFSLDLDSNRKIWNRCTAVDLQELAGFEKCLQLTLYRPRDVLSLLNDAFQQAQRHRRETLVMEDVCATAREISETRLDDLAKEYAAIVPSLRPITAAFQNANPELTYQEANDRLLPLFQTSDLDLVYQRDLAVLGGPQEAIRLLYAVGFLGTKDSASPAFVFCHDGRSPNREFAPSDRLLIHPCYWMALGATRSMMNASEAAEIHDEYEVEVHSEAPEIRNKRIGQLLAKLDRIPLGAEAAHEFEDWCLRALKVCFSGPLRNFELHPNGNASLRRDVVATNQSDSGLWRRVLEDYKSRQVIFEIKNKLGIDPDDYRQMHTYLHDDYGRLGFIITRDEKHELFVGSELDWTRTLFDKHRVLIVKLTGKFVYSLLSKLRSAQRLQKGDPSEMGLSKLLDTYVRAYLSGGRGKPEKRVGQ